MYLNDTDLIHWSGWLSCNPSNLIAAAQTTTYAWGSLAIATGAAIKPDKCYTYFLSYWYNRRQTKLRMVKTLPESIAPTTLMSGKISPSHLSVPLPDCTSAPIPTLRNKNASLMLGIYFGPTSGGNGKKRFHTGRLDQITSTPTQTCMEEFYPPTATRNDVRHCYRRHVTPQVPQTVSTGVFQMSPPP